MEIGVRFLSCPAHSKVPTQTEVFGLLIYALRNVCIPHWAESVKIFTQYLFKSDAWRILQFD
jgi:hypothetical protein